MSAVSPAITLRPVCCWNGRTPTQHRLPLPKLDILAVDADESRPEEWEAEDDVQGRTIGPHVRSKLLVKRKYSICGDMEVYEYSTEAESKA